MQARPPELHDRSKSGLRASWECGSSITSAATIRDKKAHPATFPISLARRVIELFTHEGELALDPFVGSGTTLLAAQDANRNAVGFDLQESYVRLAAERLELSRETAQVAVQDDARAIPQYLAPKSVGLILTSPPLRQPVEPQAAQQVPP